jgi:hypothetical protein
MRGEKYTLHQQRHQRVVADIDYNRDTTLNVGTLYCVRDKNGVGYLFAARGAYDQPISRPENCNLRATIFRIGGLEDE